MREGTNNFSFTQVDFEMPVEYQGAATHQLEKQVSEQTIVYYKIPKYVTGPMKESQCPLLLH